MAVAMAAEVALAVAVAMALALAVAVAVECVHRSGWRLRERFERSRRSSPSYARSPLHSSLRPRRLCPKDQMRAGPEGGFRAGYDHWMRKRRELSCCGRRSTSRAFFPPRGRARSWWMVARPPLSWGCSPTDPLPTDPLPTHPFW